MNAGFSHGYIFNGMQVYELHQSGEGTESYDEVNELSVEMKKTVPKEK